MLANRITNRFCAISLPCSGAEDVCSATQPFERHKKQVARLPAMQAPLRASRRRLDPPVHTPATRSLSHSLANTVNNMSLTR